MIEWDEKGAYESDKRRLVRCGEVPVGAVFLPLVNQKFVRWRAWVTVNMNPTDGTARSIEAAKHEVEQRFEIFLKQAGLRKA